MSLGHTNNPNGRPVGSRNRRTQEVLDLIQGRGDTDPLDALSNIRNNKSRSKYRRDSGKYARSLRPFKARHSPRSWFVPGKMVCDGKIDMATAQEAFQTDWIAAYQKYLGPPPPPTKPPNSNCLIKGNVNHGKLIYHEPGDRDYNSVVMTNCNDRGLCDKGKHWFCSAEEAERNGWMHATQ